MMTFTMPAGVAIYVCGGFTFVFPPPPIPIWWRA